jgi:hypothetical protein
MANVLQFSSRHFVQYHAFPFIAFDVIAHNCAVIFVYVQCKIHLIDVA